MSNRRKLFVLARHPLLWTVALFLGLISGVLPCGAEEPPLTVYLSRRNGAAFTTILIDALLAKRQCIIFYPTELTGVREHNRETFNRKYSFINLLDLSDTNVFDHSLVTSLQEKLSGARYSLFVPDLSFSRAYHSKMSSGFEELFRHAKQITLFEEGIFTYYFSFPETRRWVEASRNDGKQSERLAIYDQFVNGKASRYALPAVSLPVYGKYRYLITRPDLVAKIPELDIEHFDLRQKWNRLEAGERADILDFFKVRENEFEQLRNLDPQRPKLLLVGSSYFNDAEESRLYHWIDWNYQRYSSRYRLFFKPHPMEYRLASYVRTKYPGKIVVLDAQLPFELLSINDVTFEKYVVAGYSSVLLSIPPERLEHVFDYVRDQRVTEQILKTRVVLPTTILSELP